MNPNLDRVTLPDQEEAESRAWQVVSRAYREHEPQPRPRRIRPVAVAAAVAAAALIAAGVSPAGSGIVHSLREAVGLKSAAPLLAELPTRGELLVSSAEGPWIVQPNGSKRLLGSYTQAAWSPHGLYLAVTRRRELLAITPHGTVKWTVQVGATPSLPRWAPDGYRIAYVAGTQLRIVNGDGTDDHAVGVAAQVAPAWRPTTSHEHVLAYVVAPKQQPIRLIIWNDDTHELYADPQLHTMPLELLWSSDGKRLIALSTHKISIFAPNGRPGGVIQLARRAVAAAFMPRTRELTVILAGARSAAVSYDIDHPAQPPQELFGGAGRITGLAWSPDSHWLLLAWRTANQWVFVHAAPAQQLSAVSAITAQFNPGLKTGPYPTIQSWCCSP